ncbi:MAG: VOC family protein [Burkholderiales bacterium]
MPKHLNGIDHTVVCVHDLDVARETFERMGFTVTPRGYHSVGSQNHCVMLGDDYIELLALPAPHPSTAFYERFLQAGEGLAGIALRTDTAAGAYAEVTAAGFEAGAPADLSRPVQTDGEQKTAAFKLVTVRDGQFPGLRMFVCDHQTRDLVWQAPFQRHANGALGIAEIAIVSEDIGGTGAPYEQLFGSARHDAALGMRIATGGRAPITFAGERHLAKRLPNVWITGRRDAAVVAMFLQVADTAVVARHLEREAVLFNRVPGGIAVGAETAHGIALVFTDGI